MTFARALGYCLCLTAVLYGPLAEAFEQQGVNAFAVRAVKLLTPQSSLNGMVSGRWRDGFNQHDRGIAQVGYIRRRGSDDLNVGYQVHFFRNGQPGVEHRLWQQVRRRFQFLNGALDVSGRIEERFLPANRQHERVRLSNRWIKPLPNAFTLQLGYDLMYNLSDLSRNTQRGVAQNRVVLILQRPVQSARNVDWEYQVGHSRSENAVPLPPTSATSALFAESLTFAPNER